MYQHDFGDESEGALLPLRTLLIATPLSLVLWIAILEAASLLF